MRDLIAYLGIGLIVTGLYLGGGAFLCYMVADSSKVEWLSFLAGTVALVVLSCGWNLYKAFERWTNEDDVLKRSASETKPVKTADENPLTIRFSPDFAISGVYHGSKCVRTPSWADVVFPHGSELTAEEIAAWSNEGRCWRCGGRIIETEKWVESAQPAPRKEFYHCCTQCGCYTLIERGGGPDGLVSKVGIPAEETGLYWAWFIKLESSDEPWQMYVDEMKQASIEPITREEWRILRIGIHA
jgi:hypothetical protein